MSSYTSQQTLKQLVQLLNDPKIHDSRSFFIFSFLPFIRQYWHQTKNGPKQNRKRSTPGRSSLSFSETFRCRCSARCDSTTPAETLLISMHGLGARRIPTFWSRRCRGLLQGGLLVPCCSLCGTVRCPFSCGSPPGYFKSLTRLVIGRAVRQQLSLITANNIYISDLYRLTRYTTCFYCRG